LTVNRQALIELNQAINKYLAATSEPERVVEMSKKGQIDDWAYDPDFDADEPRYLTPPVEKAESWHVDPPEEEESLCDEWEEEEDMDLGWHQVEIGPETSTNELPPSMKPREPLGLKYWQAAEPQEYTPEESKRILDEIQRRHSEDWSERVPNLPEHPSAVDARKSANLPDWQYGDSV